MQLESYDVFISYNRKDATFVALLVRCLEQAGLKCFQDVTGLQVFDKLDASLKAAIGRSRFLIAIMSPSYLQSYWCLFEAIEAIQGQDIEQRFLPIVVRYRPDDQRLDEQFVLKALRDLDEQMSVFETQLITMKAYELSPKLDKLRFVRTHLPGVFRQMHERIYPDFALWDDQAVRSTLRQVISRLAPEAAVDLSAVALDFDRQAATPLVVPRLRELPAILWSARVGRQAWKNTPRVIGNRVYVASSGARWNEADDEDGLYCLDAETGIRLWFAHAPADANRLMVSRGRVVTGCDDGSVIAVSAVDGRLLWQTQLDGGIVAGPLKLSANIGSPIAETPDETLMDPFLVATSSGAVCLLDLRTGKQIDRLEVPGPLLGDIESGAMGHRDLLWLPAADGRLHFLEYDDIYLRLANLGNVQLRYVDKHAQEGSSVPLLAARPLVHQGMVIQGMVRQTYYDDPPLMALDAVSGELRWEATDSEGAGGGFGNLRGAPVVIGREVIFATAYSGGVAAVSLDNGRFVWALDLSQAMFEQWSGPVVSGSSLYLGRHDGYLHKVNAAARRREWSIYLGDSSHAGVTVSGHQALPEFQAHAAWATGGSAPVLATPACDSGRLYVGTYEGVLYCLVNLGDDG